MNKTIGATVIILAASLAVAQQFRDIPVKIPTARVPELRAMCDELQAERDPVPATFTLAQCLRQVGLEASRLALVARDHRESKARQVRDVDDTVQ